MLFFDALLGNPSPEHVLPHSQTSPVPENSIGLVHPFDLSHDLLRLGSADHQTLPYVLIVDVLLLVSLVAFVFHRDLIWVTCTFLSSSRLSPVSKGIFHWAVTLRTKEYVLKSIQGTIERSGCFGVLSRGRKNTDPTVTMTATGLYGRHDT
jgi:hypothetical protein